MLAGVAEVGQMVTNRMEAVLVSPPMNSVGFALPGVRIPASPYVVAGPWYVARVGDTAFLSLDAVGGLESAAQRYVRTLKWYTRQNIV